MNKVSEAKAVSRVSHLHLHRIMTISNIALPNAINEKPSSSKADGVSALLSQYQGLLLHIMNEPDIPGVSSRELEAFRNEFSTFVHTCRLRKCPYATVGFETQELRVEHEVSHVRRYPCTRLGCQYPPFLSPGSLKAHVRKEHWHDTATPPRSIRRVKTAATNLGALKERRQAPILDPQTEVMMEKRAQGEVASGVPGPPSSVVATIPRDVDNVDVTTHALSPENSNHALQDSQMQKVLPGQQNKKGAAMASQAQNELSRSGSGTPVNPEPTITSAKPDQNQSSNAADTSVTALQKEPPERAGRAIPPKEANAASSYWSVAEMTNFPELLRSFGTDWQAIAQHMTTKTATMVSLPLERGIILE